MIPFPQIASDSIAILLFHGVIEEPHRGIRNYTAKHISVNRFEEILDNALAVATPVSMHDVIDIADGRREPPHKGFAITFDDGFENNCSVAAPILRRLGVPAMFYVTSDFIDDNGSSWVDQLEASIETSASVELNDEILGITGKFTTPAEKIALLDDIRRIVKGTPTIDPIATASRLAGDIDRGHRPAWLSSLDQKMSWEQARELDADPLFAIGGHGRTHRILDYLDDASLDAEIEHSLRRLSDELGRPIGHYSYPEGLPGCYSDRVIESLRKRGVVCCPTAEPGVVRPGDDLFRLKRNQMA